MITRVTTFSKIFRRTSVRVGSQKARKIKGFRFIRKFFQIFLKALDKITITRYNENEHRNGDNIDFSRRYHT